MGAAIRALPSDEVLAFQEKGSMTVLGFEITADEVAINYKVAADAGNFATFSDKDIIVLLDGKGLRSACGTALLCERDSLTGVCLLSRCHSDTQSSHDLRG